jgi:hypothetical protein
MSVLGLFLVTTASTCEGVTDPPPDTCVTGRTMTIGTDVTGAVAGGDCALPDGDGRVGDSYEFTLASQSIVRFNVNGATETGIRIRDNSLTSDEKDVALHDNGLSQYQTFAVLKAGTYTLDISADENDAAGDYTIVSAVLTPPEQPTGCLQPPGQWRFANVGVTVSGVLKNGDCPGGVNNVYDAYVIKQNGPGPRKITVTVSGGAAVEIHNWDTNALVGTPAAKNTAGDIIVNIPPAIGYYAVSILTQGPGVTINYTIKIE